MLMIDAKYILTIYKLKKKLSFHAIVNVFEQEAYDDSDGSYNEVKDPDRKWEGRTQVVRSESIQHYSNGWKVVKAIFSSAIIVHNSAWNVHFEWMKHRKSNKVSFPYDSL